MNYYRRLAFGAATPSASLVHFELNLQLIRGFGGSADMQACSESKCETRTKAKVVLMMVKYWLKQFFNVTSRKTSS